MCLIALAYNHHPGYHLVLAANRDEFLDRPTAPLGYNFTGEAILAGRDLRGGGTWLALASDGRFGAITNYRDPTRLRPAAPSRGEIIPDYLRSGLDAGAFLEAFTAGAKRYNGFNLLLGDRRNLFHYSNISDRRTLLESGVYGLSNHLLNTPWPKVERARKGLTELLATGGEPDPEGIFSLLADRQRPVDGLLPDTGVGLEWERLLGTVFIHSPNYGTRSSSLLAIRDDGQARFLERSYRHDQGVRRDGDRSFQLTLSGEH